LIHKTLIIITGPTGSGKTSLAIEVAKKYACEILNCDSRQIYKELGVAVAKPSKEQLTEVKHHFVSSHSIYEEPVSAGEYARLAKAKLSELFKENNYAVLCGGTGFYISALIKGFTYKDSILKSEIRKKVDDLYEKEGIVGLKQAIQNTKPALLDRIDNDNPARLRRALEIAYSGEDGFEELEGKVDLPFTPKLFVLNPDREALYNQINLRVEGMVRNGLVSEAKNLEEDIPVALRTIGYSEFFDYFKGELTKEEAIDKVKQHSRNYAKRQLTFSRNQFADAIWIEPNSAKDVIFAKV